MVDHRNMTSAQVHEPKHISDSTSADAGKVITPLSGGASELRFLTPSEVGIQQIYGESALDENTTSFSVSAASDTELYTTSDYVQLNSTRVPAAYLDEANGIFFEPTTNGLVAPISGVYRISFWMNISTDTANSKIGIKFRKNNDWCNFTIKHDVKEIGRVELISGHIITDVVAEDEITAWLASDKTADITIQDQRYTVELIREA